MSTPHIATQKPVQVINAKLNSKQDTRPQLTRWQRVRQYQPSSHLVRLLFIWWLIVVLATAFKMTDGFGISILQHTAPLLFGICTLLLIALAIACIYDGLWLMAISQVSHYRLSRDYPSNVPIYHELEIKAYLTFIGSVGSNPSSDTSIAATYLFNAFNSMGLIKSIQLEFSDDFPSQLMLVDRVNNIEDITSEKTAMSTVMAIPVLLKLNKPNKSSQDINNTAHNDDGIDDDRLGEGHHTVKISYPVLPVKRGTGYFGKAYLKVYSPFKLLHRRLNLQDNDANTHYLRVLADFSGLLNNQLAAMFEKSPHAGLQAMLQQGHGSDFLNLREYATGDAIRQIDWKASSRHRRLMSKAYEDDNDQNVVFMLDCGEQMRHQNDDSNPQNNTYQQAYDHAAAQVTNMVDEVANLGERQVNYFDKVLNAVLLLSYVANKQGDSVGLMTFGGVDSYIAPKKGVGLIRNLLNETADIKPTLQTCDYLLAAQALNRHLKKRSLIVLITNTRAEASDELTQAVRLLARKHQIVFANLTEQIVYDRLHGDVIPAELDDALLYHSLYSYEKGRLQLHQQISQQTGALCLHTTANKLPATLTQAYLSLKR